MCMPLRYGERGVTRIGRNTQGLLGTMWVMLLSPLDQFVLVGVRRRGGS
jgi:hypothetical protein